MSARLRAIHTFQGKQVLSGVWMETLDTEQQAAMYDEEERWLERDAESWLILLNGGLYRITEDPNDGYRSMAREIVEITDMMPVNWWQASERVRCHYITRWPGGWFVHEQGYELGEWWLDDWEPPESLADRSIYTNHMEHCELLVFVSRATNKPVCVFGTGNTDDYYPYFVAKFHPENMGINGGLIDITGRKDQ